VTTKIAELIYIVEDDPAIGRLISATLERFGYRWELFPTGGAFLRAFRGRVPALAILDLTLPDMDGIDILQQLRHRHACGLLVVTGRNDVHDRVMGLELGADDYVVKPFEPRELIARVRSILRRAQSPIESPAASAVKTAEFAGWRFELGTLTLTDPDGHAEALSLAEAQLLSTLLERPNQILTREQLLEGRDVAAADRSIDLRISRLRRRLEQNPEHARLIKTVYGAGYLFAAPVRWS